MKVTIGKKVKCIVGGEEKSMQIVNPNEINTTEGKISVNSPFGQALIGKSGGDEFEVELPSGKTLLVKILSISEVDK